MGKTDISNGRVNDVLIAFGLLTRLPFPAPDWPENQVPARAAWAYPLVGVVVAVLAGLVASGLIAAGLPSAFAAGSALMVLVLSTGAMHEDGLADCADGFWGGWDSDRRLKIMKDSTTGAFGVIAIVLIVGLKWAALSAIFEAGWVFLPLIASAVSSRAGMVWCMAALPNARAGGLSSTTGRPSLQIAAVAGVWAVLACGLGFGVSGVVLLAVVLGVTAIWGSVAMTKVGGQTGDVLGANQQLCDMALLGAIAALV